MELRLRIDAYWQANAADRLRVAIMSLKIIVPSRAGPIDAMWRAPEGVSRGSVLCVGGFDGGFEGPANGIFAALADFLPRIGIGVLRLDFRIKTSPGPIDAGTDDVLAGLEWLAEQGAAPVALIGHSYGGAIVIRAGARSEHAGSVAALSTQTAGIELEDLERLPPRALLLVHGAADWRLPARLSEWVYSQALEPKALHILPEATHSLRQRRDELWEILTEWVEASLTTPGRLQE